jgi:serine/threonine protein phosphatase PrpC
MIKTISLFGITDVGQVRSHNEDDFVICKDLSANDWSYKRGEILPLSEKGTLLVVADGMGGTNAGEVASHLAQQAVREYFNDAETLPEDTSEREYFLQKCILSAHQTIVNHQHANLDTAGMGTTLIVAWVIDEMVHVAWSGDSRCYILHNGDVHDAFPFTDDHSMVWELVKKGQLTAEEAREHPQSNIIMQSLGEEKSPPDPSARSAKLFKGSKVMLCSDGLNGMISDQDIRRVLEADTSDISEICKTLIAMANQAGGTDNITCLMLQVEDGIAPKPHVVVPAEPNASTAGFSQTDSIHHADADSSDNLTKGSPADFKSAETSSSGIKTGGGRVSSNTAVLRSKVSVRNYLIAALVIIVLALVGALASGLISPGPQSPPVINPADPHSSDPATNPDSLDLLDEAGKTIDEIETGDVSTPASQTVGGNSGTGAGGQITPRPTFPTADTTPATGTPPATGIPPADSNPPANVPGDADTTTPPADSTTPAVPPVGSRTVTLTPIQPDSTVSTPPPTPPSN